MGHIPKRHFVRKTREYYDLAKHCGKTMGDAQRLIANAARFEVAPLKFTHTEHGSDYFIDVSPDGWIHEQVLSEDGVVRLENRSAFAGGAAIRIQHWSTFQSSITALQDMARSKPVEVPGPVMPQKVEVLDMRFASNGQLIAQYRERGQKAARYGIVYVPRGEAGGGATITAAPWAVGKLPEQPADTVRAIEEANANVSPVRVVSIKGQRRGTPVGYYIWN